MGKRILIIEDDDSVAELVRRALATTYEVEVIVDGDAALRRVQQEPVADLVICDVMLPGADGFTIARKAKSSEWSRVPIIFLTARSTPRDVIEGIQSGARSYIMKPFKLADLHDKVKRALKR